jgi:hypothetical protein
MTLAREDFAILDKFHFDVSPVGIKFLAKRPERIDRLGESMVVSL